VERPRDVLAGLSALVHDRLAPVTVGGATEGGWIGLDHLLRDPRALAPLVAVSGGRRFRSDDWALVVAQVARESIQVLVTAAVTLWTRDRRLFDMSAANVVLREGAVATEVGLRRARLAVLAGDPLAPLASLARRDATGAHVRADVESEVESEVEVVTEAEMLHRLAERVIGRPVPLGAVPRGPADQVAPVAAIVATVRRTVRSGQRHLWGTAGLAIGSTLASASHAIGERADRDRDALFAARRDLARTVDLTTVDDALGGTVTFALRRTCCLLLKLPDEAQCGTCSLRDHDACVARMTDWHRAERRRRRSTT
jgi:hypothetical protein